jgi:hypothetical protein
MNPFAMFIVVIVNVYIISVTLCILELVLKLVLELVIRCIM